MQLTFVVSNITIVFLITFFVHKVRYDFEFISMRTAKFMLL